MLAVCIVLYCIVLYGMVLIVLFLNQIIPDVMELRALVIRGRECPRYIGRQPFRPSERS
jgi:hypothetical protein